MKPSQAPIFHSEPSEATGSEPSNEHMEAEGSNMKMAKGNFALGVGAVAYLEATESRRFLTASTYDTFIKVRTRFTVMMKVSLQTRF